MLRTTSFLLIVGAFSFFALTAARSATIALTWDVSPGTDVSHYHIYRCPTPDSPFSTAYLHAEVDSPEFLESEAPEGVYYYWIAAVDSVGNQSESAGPLEVCLNQVNGSPSATSSGAVPQITALLPSFPNPFNLSTTIAFGIAASSANPIFVNLIIYNSLGQEVRHLLEKNLESGWYQANWDGKNDQGATVATGMYVCSLQTNTRRDFIPLVLLK